MTDQMILTPYFMDQLVPQMQPMLEPGWLIVQPEATGDLYAQIKSNTADIAEGVAGAVASGRRPVSIAGDCMSPIGVLAGLHRAEVAPSLIWFDAHGDFNTLETSPSGFLGGMPLAMLVGRGDQTFMDNVSLPPIPEARVILTDARDLDPGERKALESSAVRHLPNVTDLLTTDLPDGPLYVHFDADVLDPAEAPAHRYAAPGGASVAQMREVFAHLAATGRVRAISVSAWDYANDPDNITGEIVMDLLQVLRG